MRAAGTITNIAFSLVYLSSQAAALTQREYVNGRADAHVSSSGRTLLQSKEPDYCTCEVPIARHQDYCTGVEPARPAVVVPAGKHSSQPPGPHSTGWLSAVDVEVVQYQILDPAAPNYYSNHGNEAGAYLQYIIDRYDCLPVAVAFIHGHQHSKHSTNMLPMLKRLRWDRLKGYYDLNRVMDVWDMPLGALPDTPNASLVATGPQVYNGTFKEHQIWKGRAYDSWDMYVHRQSLAAIHTWDTCLGPAGLGPLPERVNYVCCSQFVVDRGTIRQRPKAFYQAAQGFMRNNTLQGIRHVTKNFILGDVFTMMWPAIFGPSPNYVPQPLCDMYNCQGSSERAY